MIDRLLSGNTISLSLKNRSNVTQKQSFQNVLDTSLSDQKSFQEDLRLQKYSEKKQEIQNLRKTIEQIKKQNTKNSPQSDQGLQSIEKLLISLEETMEFVEKNHSIDDEDDTFDAMALIQSMQDFLSLILDEFAIDNIQEQNLVLAEKVSFICDNIQQTEPHNFKDSAQANVLTDLIQELTSASETNHLVFDEFENQDNSSLHDHKISLENFNTIISEDESMLDYNNSEISENINTQDSSDEYAEKFVIKDLRTYDPIKLQEESFSLENIDAQVQSLDSDGSDSIILDNFSPHSTSKYDLASSVAQKAYTSFSSSISRIQVEALMQSVAGKVAMIFQDGGSELRMKLTPPELGQMKLSFMMEDSIMQGKVIVETQEAKMFFEQNIDNLRESLAQAGVKLSDVNVELGGRGEFTNQEEEIFDSVKALRISSAQEKPFSIRKAMISDSLVDFTA